MRATSSVARSVPALSTDASTRTATAPGAGSRVRHLDQLEAAVPSRRATCRIELELPRRLSADRLEQRRADTLDLVLGSSPANIGSESSSAAQRSASGKLPSARLPANGGCWWTAGE